ncbi:TPM domain-containing protein [Bacillus sp. FJAT-49711]|uniref:TPM domain-containing protein n=1 Tax=Bacillus sp. FJAT-49711 TaxID=2833585 RepID=UPI001BC99DA3|nr:TPM domain-containing protein [Bacillus sp. FJAT-49711]MBS4217413.1 TPM domain-containing protein [Bacillus sp. FJAT-49711]
MKKAHLLIILVILIALFLPNKQVFADTVPNPVGDIYVQDFANILTSTQKKELIKLGTYLDKESEAQLAILTVHSLESIPVEEYAANAYDEYELGRNDENNGVLLLFALNDRKIYIEVGSALKKKLTDKNLGKILDTHALPYLEKSELAQAITNTYKKLFNEVADEYGINKQVKTESFEYGYNDGSGILSLIIFIFVVLGIIYLDYRFLGSAVTLTILRLVAVIVRKILKRKRRRRSRV